MDWLLPEIAAEVARYLTPRDLSACCAVSPHWRQIFGTDEVWKPHYDRDLEEHLRTTPCVVQPAFQLPQAPDSTLAPVSQWRAAFLREQHLCLNWRKGNCKTVEHRLEKMKISLEQFVTNDFLISVHNDTIDLWNVKVIPPVQMDTFTFTANLRQTPIVFENGLIFLKCHHFIQILEADVMKGTITMKYQFYLTGINKLPVMVCSQQPLRRPDIETYPLWTFHVLITAGIRFIGYFEEDDNDNSSFHVWDMSGMKLKEEPYPPNSLICRLEIVVSKTCDDVLMLFLDSDLPNQPYKVSVHFYVYNTQQLKFLPFQIRRLISLNNMAQRYNDTCAIINNYIALTDYDEETREIIRIFDYRTGYQMLKIYTMGSKVKVNNYFDFIFIKSSIMCDVEKKVSRLCSFSCKSGNIIEDITGFEVLDFEVIGKGIVEVCPVSEYPEIWKIDKSSIFKTAVTTFPDFKTLNQACTRLVHDKTFEKIETIRISHFW